MDNANKIISFVLGLVVVIVFFVVLTGRLNLKNLKILPLAKNTSPTPTILITPTPEFITISEVVVDKTNNQIAQRPNKIPATGAPIELLPLLVSGLFGGIYLRRKK